MAAGMCVPLVLLLSAVVLHSASAGGAYCAKAARARAAALGLAFPGVHGAPDLHRPARYGMQPGTGPFRRYLYRNAGPGAAGLPPSVAYYKQNRLGAGSLDGRAPEPARRRSSESTFQLNHDAYDPAPPEYAGERVAGLPGGLPVGDLESNSEQVKRVAPPAWAEAPGRPGLMNWGPQGRAESLPFVYNGHGLVFDGSVPDRHAMTRTGLPLPHSRGRGIYHRGLAGYGFGRRAPVLGSPPLPYRPQTGRGPAFPTWGRILPPAHHAQPPHRNVNVKQSVQGNPLPRRVMKPVPLRISG